MKSKLLPFALVVLLAPAVFAQDYEIRLHRASKPGDQQKISVTVTESKAVNVTTNGVATKDDKTDITIQFDGVAKSVEVDDKGRDTKTIFTIDKFTQTTGGDTKEVLPKGTVITASVDAGRKDVFEIDGKPVEPDVATALHQVVQLSHGGATDDEVFGTTEHKKKGDSWDVNADLAMKDMKETGGGIELKNLTGKITLDDVAGGSLKISSHVKSDVTIPLPPNIIVDQATTEANMKGTFPTDVTKTIPEQSMEMIMSFTAHTDGPAGEKIVIKSTVHQTKAARVTDLK